MHGIRTVLPVTVVAPNRLLLHEEEKPLINVLLKRQGNDDDMEDEFDSVMGDKSYSDVDEIMVEETPLNGS